MYQRYTHLVFGVCLKHLQNEAEAEDMTMHVFEKLIGSLKKHQVTSFKSWLHTLVKNECMMYFRKNTAQSKKENKLRFEKNEVVENEEVNHLQEAEEKEFVLKHLQNGIEELKEEQRECIELFYLKDCSYTEISSITGYDLKEVKSHIQNGKRNLKNFINAKSNEAKDGKNELG